MRKPHREAPVVARQIDALAARIGHFGNSQENEENRHHQPEPGCTLLVPTQRLVPLQDDKESAEEDGQRPSRLAEAPAARLDERVAHLWLPSSALPKLADSVTSSSMRTWMSLTPSAAGTTAARTSRSGIG